nr:Protein T03F7.7, isoform b [Haemonchus contortus]
MPAHISPEPFSEDIMEKARKMRSTIQLPACFDSPFFLARFLRAHGGDEEVAKQRVEEYLSHSHQSCEIVRKCTQPGRLIWNFTISGDVEFEIVRREAGKEIKVWPKITLTSLKLPDYGSVTVIPGEYVLRFTNPSSTWFAVKVTGAAEIKAE